MQRNLEFLNKYQGKDSKMFNDVSTDRHDSQSFQEALSTVRSVKRYYESTL